MLVVLQLPRRGPNARQIVDRLTALLARDVQHCARPKSLGVAGLPIRTTASASQVRYADVGNGS